MLGLQPYLQQGRNRIAARRGGHGYGAAAFPSVLFEVIGDAADGIDRVLPKVAMAVAVEVDRVAAIAARDELCLFVCVCVGFCLFVWVVFFFVCLLVFLFL